MKLVVVKLGDDVYERLYRIAKRMGYGLVSEYIAGILRVLAETGDQDILDIYRRLKRLEERVERLEALMAQLLREKRV